MIQYIATGSDIDEECALPNDSWYLGSLKRGIILRRKSQPGESVQTSFHLKFCHIISWMPFFQLYASFLGIQWKTVFQVPPQKTLFWSIKSTEHLYIGYSLFNVDFCIVKTVSAFDIIEIGKFLIYKKARKSFFYLI